MKQSAQKDSTLSRAAPRKTADNPSRQGGFAPTGTLTQLQAAIRSSPRVQALTQLRDDIEKSPRLQASRELAGRTRSTPGNDVTGPFGNSLPAPVQRFEETRPNRTGLPDRLKAGVEGLSGMSLDNVRVHYGSAQPAQLNALAYAQGTDIHVGPGQEEHLPHEAWHVVQQAQGRVQPTMQTKQSAPVNDDQGLEREADEMGARAGAGAVQRVKSDRPSNAPPFPSETPSQAKASATDVIQRVRGGIEFTEDSPTLMYAYNVVPGNVPAHNNFTVGAAAMTGFRVGAGIDPSNADLGNWTNQDLTVLNSSPNVELTNDVRSAEWIIKRHNVDVPAGTMKSNLKADVAHMFEARDALASEVKSIQSGHAGQAAIAGGARGNVKDGPPVFIYKPGPKKGKAQITAQYSSEDTIRRINKLNVSKYLTGTKVAEGEDVARITGTASQALIAADVQGTTSFSTAEALLGGIRATSQPIPATAGGVRLTQNQVGIVKLMVLNDALATTMVRYDANVGQAQEKNIQRFFPKSRRDEYVKTLAQANLDGPEMLALRAEILRTSAADAQSMFNHADPGALRTDEAFRRLPLPLPPHSRRMLAAKRLLADPTGGVPDPNDVQRIKIAVLGNNGRRVARCMNAAARAYTDSTPNAAGHYRPDGTGRVIETSRGFTPVAGGPGAIYEMREREIPVDKSGLLNIGSMNELNDAIDRIFDAAE